MPEVFSSDWAMDWCQALNSRPAYQAAAEKWEGSVALVMHRDTSRQSDSKAVFVDLWHGECRAAREATKDDLDKADFVLSGTAAAWRDVLTGRLAPLMAVMGGKLRLTRGSMAALVPHAAAAKELVASATAMTATFPDGWA